MSGALNRTMTQEELLALPVTVPVVEAGRAFGLSRDGVYDLLRSGRFPCRTIRVGRANVVARAELLRVLGVTDPTTAGGPDTRLPAGNIRHTRRPGV